MPESNAVLHSASWRVMLPTVALLSLVIAVEASAADGEREMRITSDSLQHDIQKDTVHATGNVNVEWKGARLTADDVEY